MPKYRTQAVVMQQKYMLNKRDILAMTFMSEEAYNNHQFNTAIAWIRHTIWNDEDLETAITSQLDFWKWWINQWNLRDDQFLTDHIEYTLYEGCNGFLTQEELRAEYLLTHLVHNIEVMPDDEVMKRAYEAMITTAVKSQAK